MSLDVVTTAHKGAPGLLSAALLTLGTLNYKFFKNVVLTKSTKPCVSTEELYPPHVYSFTHEFSQIRDFQFKYQKALVEYKL